MQDYDETESLLIGANSLNKAIKADIEAQIALEKGDSTAPRKTSTVKKLSKLDKTDIFSSRSVWKVFNRKTKQESDINGLQAESYVGMNVSLRERILSGELDSFLTGEYFVKFDHAEV